MREMDLEIRKIHAIVRILDGLEPASRVRVMDYVRARAVEEVMRRELEYVRERDAEAARNEGAAIDQLPHSKSERVCVEHL